MGIYLNPANGQTKEYWLVNNCADYEDWTIAPTEHLTDEGIVVCLVDNGLFTAAGVAFDAEELKAFTGPDRRTKLWFRVPVDKLDASVLSAHDLETLGKLLKKDP